MLVVSNCVQDAPSCNQTLQSVTVECIPDLHRGQVNKRNPPCELQYVVMMWYYNADVIMKTKNEKEDNYKLVERSVYSVGLSLTTIIKFDKIVIYVVFDFYQ